MHPRFFLLLFLFNSGFLSAQQDIFFRRGVTLGVEFGLATDPSRVYNYYQPTAKGLQLLNTPADFSNSVAFFDADSLSSYFTPLPIEAGKSVRTASALARYNLQLHLTKKLSSGLEFGGGIFLSSGRFAPKVAVPPNDAYVFRSFAYDYLRSGVTGSLKFHLLRSFRLQPYLGVQTLFLFERRRNTQSRWRYAPEGLEANVATGLSGPETVFDLDLQLLGGLDYPLTNRCVIGLTAAFLGTTRSTYGGVRLSWVLTDY